MKTVILAGGFGSRLSEESISKPKPMVEIGDKPILWHILKIYSSFGYNDFVILLGYKGYLIKEYFCNYYLHESTVQVDLSTGSTTILENNSEDWKITLVETGLNTMTGSRIKKAQNYIGDEPFMLTYGDGVSNVNINDLLKFHKDHGRIATMTSAQPDGRFGALEIDDLNTVIKFREKPKGDGSWVNAGFFVFGPEIFEYIPNCIDSVLETSTLTMLSEERQLCTYKHDDFWMPMDTLRDKNILNDLWNSDHAKWKIW